MPYEMGMPDERFFAMRTGKWLLTGVRLFVHDKIALELERNMAQSADVRPLTRVDPRVRDQSDLAAESLVAE